MRKSMRKAVQTALLTMVLGMVGCTDGVRQTITPYVFDGLGQIIEGLFAGLEQQMYPEGTSSSED